METEEVLLQTVVEWGRARGISKGRAYRLLAEGRVVGARRVAGYYVVPVGAEVAPPPPSSGGSGGPVTQERGGVGWGEPVKRYSVLLPVRVWGEAEEAARLSGVTRPRFIANAVAEAALRAREVDE